MNLGITVTFSATAELLEVLRAVSKAPASAPAAAAPGKPKQMAAVKDPAPQEQVEEKTDATPSASEIAGGLTIEKVRLKVSEKTDAGKTAQVKKLLAEHGAPSVSKLDPAQFDSFYSKVAAL